MNLNIKKALWLTAMITAGLLALLVLFVLILNIGMWLNTRSRVMTTEEFANIEAHAGEFDCILILGAGVRPGGVPSDMLRDRLEVGIELYFAGYTDRIVMSGDHMGQYYDEVSVMKRYAIEAGVPSDSIYLDHAGLSTYDSISRLAASEDVGRVLIVTQSYHLYRALHLARRFGIDAYGLSADLRSYRGQLARDVREIAARTKDCIYAIAKPDPTFVGHPIVFADGGDATNQNPFWTEETS